MTSSRVGSSGSTRISSPAANAAGEHLRGVVQGTHRVDRPGPAALRDGLGDQLDHPVLARPAPLVGAQPGRSPGLPEQGDRTRPKTSPPTHTSPSTGRLSRARPVVDSRLLGRRAARSPARPRRAGPGRAPRRPPARRRRRAAPRPGWRPRAPAVHPDGAGLDERRQVVEQLLRRAQHRGGDPGEVAARLRAQPLVGRLELRGVAERGEHRAGADAGHAGILVPAATSLAWHGPVSAMIRHARQAARDLGA